MRIVWVKFVTVLQAERPSYIPKTLEVLFLLHSYRLKRFYLRFIPGICVYAYRLNQ